MPYCFRYLVLLCLFLQIMPVQLFAQQFNRPLPSGVASYIYRQYDSACQGYLLTAPVTIHPTRPGNGIAIEPQVILDCNGYVLWYGNKQPEVLNTDFKYHPRHGLFSYCAVYDSATYIHYILNHKLQVVDSVTNLAGILPDMHDFLILPNGNYLITGRLDSVVELRGRSARLMGFVLQEINRQHKLIWQWNSNEHLDPANAIESYKYDSTMFDYCHGNSVSIANDGGYLISFRNMDAVYKIDRNTGRTIWVLGGKNSNFNFTNHRGLSGQHNALQLPNGNITVYNNGNSFSPQYSEAVEYRLDTVLHTAAKVWSSNVRNDLYAPGMGSFAVCTNGNRLIGYGQVSPPTPAIQLIDSNNKLLCDVTFGDKVMSYRTYLLEDKLRLNRPVVKQRRVTSGVELIAPAGYSAYMWNTGETTRTISIIKPGVYMVWVNYGNGMLGSVPVMVNSIH